MEGAARRRKEIRPRSLWGRVAYVGESFAAADGTYAGVSVAPLNFAPRHDAGPAPLASVHTAEYGHLVPLIVAALWEAGFSLEVRGPLSTWQN